MMQPLILVFSLGLAGIDPLGLSLLVAALAAGAGKPHVIAFSLAAFVGTVALGVVFSVFGEQISGQISAFIPDANDPEWAVVEIIVAALIFYWVVSHFTGQSEAAAPAEPKSPPRSSVMGIALSGLAFSLSALTDPTFFAAAAIASQASGLIPMIGLHAVWTLTSQSLLFVFAVAYLFDAHEPLTNFVKPIWEKIKRPAMGLFLIGLIILAIGLTADAMALFFTGEYLVPL